MGCRAHIVNLETGEKVYSHGGASDFFRAGSFEELREDVREMYQEEIEHRSPEEEGLDEFTDEDAVEDIDRHIERIYVIDEGEFRGYTRTMLDDSGDKISDNMVVFKFDDSTTFWKARHTSVRLEHYNEAYRRQNMDEHKSEALEQSLRNRLANVDRNVNVIYSSVPPRRYDLAIKDVVKDWPGKDKQAPESFVSLDMEGSA